MRDQGQISAAAFCRAIHTPTRKGTPTASHASAPAMPNRTGCGRSQAAEAYCAYFDVFSQVGKSIFPR